MFTAVLLLLLLLALPALGFLGYYAFRLRLKVTQVQGDLSIEQDNCRKEIDRLKQYAAGIKAQQQEFVNKNHEEAKKWNERAVALKEENQRLAKWKNIADADQKAAEMLRLAQDMQEKANADARTMVSSAQERATVLMAQATEKVAAELATAKATASAIIAEARDKAKAQRDETQGILNSATIQASKILETANKKAEETAGSAYEALKNARLYEHTVKAMKNIIDGYGDRYIIPEQSLLDDLAEDFSHTQAGQELKRARECTTVMIRNGTAAACGYVEANRRETAVNFVIDAFNGKVESILSRTKYDNAGKLTQQIRDAFALVNYNGKAFRDARINETYLAARLDELKWAAVTQHFATQEREEQREVKERAREEARAAKEIERALRDAAKEEGVLQKAMAQAQEQGAQATGEQKTMYEARLQEMGVRLKEALERKDRARSMAEQTKKGHVYIISNIGSFGDDVYKIGLTRRWDPKDRVTELGGASVPFGFDVHALIVSENAPALERQLHEHFVLRQVNKVNHRKEFFRATLKEIREEIEKLGLTGISWTMTAVAKDYGETIATETRIKDNASERQKWITRQLRLESESPSELELAGALDEEE